MKTQDEWEESLREYRRQHFSVELRPTHHATEPEETTLSITHNGKQWQSISLTPREMFSVIQALLTYKPEVKRT